MSDPFGFLKVERKNNPYREVQERIQDWEELQLPLSLEDRQLQASRCMSCGIPFCHQGEFYGTTRQVSGCPNDNLIPEWNDYLYRGDVKGAFLRLSRTNPLPEMTGRVCPAPCEAGCTEFLNGSGVTIHDNERFIIDTAFEKGWVEETGKPLERNGYKIAIVGSGPSGLAAAWRANQLGYEVTVFEKNDRFGGLLMYGIPNMKLDKSVVERRIQTMKNVGISFVANCEIGVDKTFEELKENFDSILLTIGASVPRDLNVKGREAKGIEFAVDFLSRQTKSLLEHGSVVESLQGKKVVVIGGGDTGNDCLATCIRMGCTDITQLEITPQPQEERSTANPWPEYPLVLRKGYGQEEAETVMGRSVTLYSVSTTEFSTSETNEVSGLSIVEVDGNFQAVEGTDKTIDCDLVILAMGFTGVEEKIMDVFDIGQVFDDFSTNQPNVFVAGDAKRGPSLVIWGIREGRKAIDTIHDQLQRNV